MKKRSASETVLGSFSRSWARYFLATATWGPGSLPSSLGTFFRADEVVADDGAFDGGDVVFLLVVHRVQLVEDGPVLPAGQIGDDQIASVRDGEAASASIPQTFLGITPSA